MRGALLVQSSKAAAALLLRRPSARFTSTNAAGALTTVQVNEKTGVATLTLNRPPVNGLNLELLCSIKGSIEEIESNKSRGLILTSSNDRVFCAGLDILELYKPDPERLRNFWVALQDTWLALFGSSVPTAAAINGHSPAGGCLLALACEYRAMMPNCTIGLNETKLGIVAPQWFMDTMLNVVSRRVTEMALTQGYMFTTEEALKVGLIDAVAQDKAATLALCEKFIGTFAKINPFARAMTKQKFRGPMLEHFEKTREKDVDSFLFFVNQPMVQKGLGVYLDALKNKSKK